METYTFLKVDKTINDVPLKNLTFQTGQTKWDGGSTNYLKIMRDQVQKKKIIIIMRDHILFGAITKVWIPK